MTTAIQKAKPLPNLPVSILEEMNREALQIADRIAAPSGDFISVTKNKTFRLPGVDTEAPVITAIVLDWVSYNTLYDGKYDPKNIKPPVCVAIGKSEKELAPFPDSPKKAADGCYACPNNQWGTDGRGKLCKNQRMLAVVSPTDQENGPIMVIRVSPTGVKHWDDYAKHIMQGSGPVTHPCGYITEMSFDPSQDYASLRFKPLELNEQLQVAWGRRREALTRLLTPPTFSVPVKD